MHAVLAVTAMLALSCSAAARRISPAAPTLRAALNTGGHAQRGALLSQAPPLQRTPCAWLRPCTAVAAGGRSLTAALSGRPAPLLHRLRGTQAWANTATVTLPASRRQDPRWRSAQLVHSSSNRPDPDSAAVSPIAQSSASAGSPDGAGPTDAERGRTARDVLTIVAGGKLADPELVSREFHRTARHCMLCGSDRTQPGHQISSRLHPPSGTECMSGVATAQADPLGMACKIPLHCRSGRSRCTRAERAAAPQDRSIRGALVWVPEPPPPPPAWAVLCAGVEVAGPAALHWALGWRRRRVPDVEGAAGEPSLALPSRSDRFSGASVPLH